MKKTIALLLLLALLLSGCGKKETAAVQQVDTSQWSNFRLVVESADQPAVYVFSQKDKWGLADAEGKTLLEPKFVWIEEFIGEYAMANFTDTTAEPEEVSGYAEYPSYYGVINRRGETVIDFKYDSLNRQSNGLYICEEDDLFGLLSLDGKVVLEPSLSYISDFYGYYSVCYIEEEIIDEDGNTSSWMHYGLINDRGEILIPMECDSLKIENNVAIAMRKGEIVRYALKDRKAELLVPETVDQVEISAANEKLCDDPVIYSYMVGDLVGLADGEGNVLTDAVFADVKAFRGGHAVAAVFDFDGTPVDMSGYMEYPKFYGVIDTMGNTIVEFEEERNISLSDDGRIIRYRGKDKNGSTVYGYKTIEGKIIAEPMYMSAEDFMDGFAVAAIFEAEPDSTESGSGPSGDYRFGVIDTEGREIIQMEYDEMTYNPEDGVITAKRGDKTEYFRIVNGKAEKIREVGTDFNEEDYYPFTGKLVAKLDGEPTLAARADNSYGHPRLDGATALLPVYAAFVEAVYPEGTAMGDGNRDNVLFTCTKTNRAYERLIEGAADMIFVAGPSDAQIEMAKQAGVEFELTPFGREAFVFIVNKDNPLESITIEEIQRIYSGEITDWSDLGVDGLGEIVAYQRPENSGSQTALEKLMGDIPLMEAPAESTPDFMGEMLDVIEYRNLPNAIGYTFRFYCTDMVGSDVKLLAIDGIEPTVENIRNESYPICSTLYAVTRKGEKNPNVRALLDWILSEQGTELIEKSGYVALD